MLVDAEFVLKTSILLGLPIGTVGLVVWALVPYFRALHLGSLLAIALAGLALLINRCSRWRKGIVRQSERVRAQLCKVPETCELIQINVKRFDGPFDASLLCWVFMRINRFQVF